MISRHVRVPLPLLAALVLLVALTVVLPLGAIAHPGNGFDVGQARMTATSQGASARVSIEVIDPRPCTGIEAQAATATRADLTVSGGLQPDGECRFSGTLQVPEQGKWAVSFNLLIDGQRSQVNLPISVTDEKQEFLGQDWLHVDAIVLPTPTPSTLERVQNALPGGTALIGVGLGVLALAAWVWRGRRDRTGLAPEQGHGPTAPS